MLSKVNWLRPIFRQVIALHSPNARLETGLRICPPERSRNKVPFAAEQSVLCTGLSRTNRTKWACFAYFGGTGDGISLQLRLRGGEAGIRTLGTGVSPYNGLANRRIRPLCHLSGVSYSLARLIFRPSSASNRKAFVIIQPLVTVASLEGLCFLC